MEKADIFTIEEAAEYLSVKPTTVRWLYRTNRLPMFKLGKGLRIRRDDLNLFIEQLSLRLPKP